MPTICLALIVKNAEDSVERCIRSALPIVDRWLIIDTGSTDKTKQVVSRVLEDMPGQLLERPWVGHAVNRTELLAETRKSGADFTLMLDADMELAFADDGFGRFPVTDWRLDADEYLITIDDRGMDYPLPLLTRSAKPYTYAGVAHACLNCTEPSRRGRLDGVRILDHGGGPGKDGKFEKDLANLQAEVLRNPNDTRSWFYLAQTYRDLDRHLESIEAYKHRAQMGGFEEEVYFSLYQAGLLTSAYVSYSQGARLLLQAWEMRPHRAEALRALAGCTNAVADKIPFPADDLLFVERGAYRGPNIVNAPRPDRILEEVIEDAEPVNEVHGQLTALKLGAPNISPGKRDQPRWKKVRTSTGGYTNALDPRDVCAVIPTRGNVDMDEILETLPYGQVIVWNNSEKPFDYKVFGRYAAIAEVTKPVIYWQDDDIIFRAHKQLLAAYEPGLVVANMDMPWIQGAGYGDFLAMVGAGSLCDADIPARIWDEYLAHYPFDEEVLLECDFAFGTMAPFKRVDLGYEVRPFADDADRLYQQPGQTERKHAMIARGRELKSWRDLEQIAETPFGEPPLEDMP